MAAKNRKIPKEVQELFEKYTESHVRRLKKEDAVRMLESEFSLTPQQAFDLFSSFDKDYNGSMSLWEFAQFFQIIGSEAKEMVRQFEALDVDGSGKLDAGEARAGLSKIRTTGSVERSLCDKEIDFFIKSSTGDDGLIDLGHFCNLLYRLKVYKPKK